MKYNLNTQSIKLHTALSHDINREHLFSELRTLWEIISDDLAAAISVLKFLQSLEGCFRTQDGVKGYSYGGHRIAEFSKMKYV
jgi:hypothetical protein